MFQKVADRALDVPIWVVFMEVLEYHVLMPQVVWKRLLVNVFGKQPYVMYLLAIL